MFLIINGVSCKGGMFQTRIGAPSTHRFGSLAIPMIGLIALLPTAGMGIIPRGHDPPLRKNDVGSRDLPDIAIGRELFAAAAPLRPALARANRQLRIKDIFTMYVIRPKIGAAILNCQRLRQ